MNYSPSRPVAPSFFNPITSSFFGVIFVVTLTSLASTTMFFLPALIVAATFSPVMHPLHVAYTNIDINPEEKSVYVTHKIFTQDFTLLFAHLFEKNIEPEPDREFTQPEKDLLAHYMKYRFNLVSGQDTLELNYTGKQIDGESLFLRYKGALPGKGLNELTINNLLFLDLYMDQTNLVIVNFGDEEKGLRFDWDDRVQTLKLVIRQAHQP